MIGNQIKQYLKDNGLLQHFIAKKVDLRLKETGSKVNMTAKTFNALLNGNRGVSVDEYFAICYVLGVDTNTFCNKEDVQ